MRHTPLLRRSLCSLFASLLVIALAAVPARARGHAQDAAHATSIAPKFYLFSNPAANLVLMIGEDASFIAGVQDPQLVKLALATLRDQKGPAVKYAVIIDDEQAPGYRDGGWGHRGAITIAQELLYARIRRAAGPAGDGAASELAMPAMGYSDVLQLHVKGEDTHVIHQRAGYSDADAVIHFEGSGIAYLGPTFTSDGYPRLDTAHGGKLGGMIDTVDFFVMNFNQRPDAIEPIIPGRGPVATMADLRAYGQMLHAVRDRVAGLVKSGKPLAEIVAARPTAEFDAKWGHGPVTPDQFVTMVQAAVSKE
jgi:cyclase